jgi:hypothetical protein
MIVTEGHDVERWLYGIEFRFPAYPVFPAPFLRPHHQQPHFLDFIRSSIVRGELFSLLIKRHVVLSRYTQFTRS